MDKRVEELIERGVAALEKLAQDEIEFQIEAKPPVCPHCNVINPNIRTESLAGAGPMAEHFSQVNCMHCYKVFYYVPLQVECVKTQAELRAVIEEKVRLGGFQRDSGTEHQREDSAA